jgi:hypothetical protein
LAAAAPARLLPKTGDYRLPIDRQVLVEAVLALYAWILLYVAVLRNAEGMIVFLGLFAFGFTLVVLLSVLGDRPWLPAGA